MVSTREFYKRIQIRAVGQQILNVDHVSFEKIAPAEHPAGQHLIRPLNRRDARDEMLKVLIFLNLKALSTRLGRVALTKQQQ